MRGAAAQAPAPAATATHLAVLPRPLAQAPAAGSLLQHAPARAAAGAVMPAAAVGDGSLWETGTGAQTRRNQGFKPHRRMSKSSIYLAIFLRHSSGKPLKRLWLLAPRRRHGRLQVRWSRQRRVHCFCTRLRVRRRRGRMRRRRVPDTVVGRSHCGIMQFK